MRRNGWLVLMASALLLGGCEGSELDTRTFEVKYLSPSQAEQLVSPYVYTDRSGAPGVLSATSGALTVRETEDNLAKIERVLGEFDRARPTIMLQFQIIEANGASVSSPAIADVERELRRLFRFDGYELVEEAQIIAMEGTRIRQVVGNDPSRDAFAVEGGVREVRGVGDSATVMLEVKLWAPEIGDALETFVTIPTGSSVVLGTARSPAFEGALILVVRADVIEPSAAEPSPRPAGEGGSGA